MLRTHKAGKGPGVCEGWGLGSRNRWGPGVTPTPVSEGRGPHLGAQQASWARVGGANALLSSPAPPVWGLGGPLPPASPDLPGLPTMPPGPTGLKGALDCRGPAWEVSRLPGPQWAGQSPSTPLPLLLDGSCHLPLLISQAPLLCLQDPRGLDGLLMEGSSLGAQQAPQPKWAR